MSFPFTSAFAVLALSTQSIAQNLCNKTIASANVSGVFDYHVPYYQDTNDTLPIPEVSWAVTVDTLDDAIQTNLWYSTGGQNYSNDVQLGYDVCAYIITGMPANTVALGQDDPGDCSDTLSEPCRKAIIGRATSNAFWLVANPSPPPYSNLSAGDIEWICDNVLVGIGNKGFDYPEECSQEFGYVDAKPNYDVTTNQMALTGFNESGLDIECPLQVGDKTYYKADGLLYTTPDTYDYATRLVYPILTVYMPVANADAFGRESNAFSKLTCARGNKFAEGSRVSPALPSGTPYSYGHSLSKGAIAGIAVGITAFVAIIVGLATCFLIRRRKRRQEGSQQAESWSIDKNVQLDGTEVLELSSVDRKYEPDSNRDVVEMGEAQGTPAELDGSNWF